MKKCMQIFIFLNWKHFVPDQMSLPHLVRDRPNIAAIFGPTGQNLDATFGSRADIIWHGGTEYGSHILSGRTKYGSHIWSRTKFGCHNRSAGHFSGRTFCAVTGLKC